jgi:parallel beta-helix repeat protein
MKKIVLGLELTMLFLCMFVFVFRVQPVKAWTGTVYIRANGDVEPSDAPIERNGDIYTLNGNITSDNNDGLIIERDNILLDGASHTIQGTMNLLNKGISVSGRNNVTIKNTNIKGFWYGIFFNSSSYNSLIRNNITDNYFGIMFENSPYNTIRENNITYNGDGIYLSRSSHNRILENYVRNADQGIRIWSSSNSSVIGNVFVGDGLEIWGFGNVVVDNIVNGKPLIYLEEVSDYTVTDAGQVILVNCRNINVENLNLSNTDIGIELSMSTNIKIANNKITHNSFGILPFLSSSISINKNKVANNGNGIRLEDSRYISLIGNNITNNGIGIWLGSSSNNSIIGNNITNNDSGIDFSWSCSNNNISGNNITHNKSGISVSPSNNNNNQFYHNNFIDNTEQVQSTDSTNAWDNGYPSGGNYWSDYTGIDENNDGIGDSSQGNDRYPLMAPFKSFEAGTWNNIAYTVDTISNSTISDFYFNPEEGPFLRFNITGKADTKGFCRVTIPKDILWTDSKWKIYVGDEEVPYTIILDENHTYLYFTYNHSTKTVVIQGTHAIPEFPHTMTLPAFTLLTVAIAVLSKKKKLPRTNPVVA